MEVPGSLWSEKGISIVRCPQTASLTQLVREVIMTFEDLDHVIQHPQIHGKLRSDLFHEVRFLLWRDVEMSRISVG